MTHARQSAPLPIVADGRRRAMAGAAEQLCRRRERITAAAARLFGEKPRATGGLRRLWGQLRMRIEIHRRMRRKMENIAPRDALYACSRMRKEEN